MPDKSDIMESNESYALAENLQTVRKVAHWIILIGGSILGAAFITFSTWNVWNDAGMRKVVQEHFAAVIGLPACAIASLCVVLFLEGTSGPIEFEGFGFKFKGAAGPLIFWVICFCVMAAAVKLIW